MSSDTTELLGAEPPAFHVLQHTLDIRPHSVGDGQSSGTDSEFETLLENSSLGTDGARRLRERTPLTTARSVAGEGPQQRSVPRADLVDIAGSNDERLRAILREARFVLFDFDGPICRLFGGHPAQQAAESLVNFLELQGLIGSRTPKEFTSDDPYAIFRALALQSPDSDLVYELEERLTQEELRAVSQAMPTAYADPLLRTWNARGARLGVCTPVSSRAAQSYLASRRLADCLAAPVFGRRYQQRLEPIPYRIDYAMATMAARPDSTVMIGSSPGAIEAARQAGIPFFGYGRRERVEKELLAAGATCTVSSLEPVLRIVRDAV
ncbi:HAD family hydrolase [Streptomyces sp. 2A115]|uniref:HAD family hydrolase n=1 Tax=Streptomyces sp. 2A115 TaxID=3457439 RepID=UPI003FCF5744